MKSNIKTDKRTGKIFLLLAFAASACLISLCAAGMTAEAKEQAFVIDAGQLPSGESTCDIRLTIENTGEDWEGTVRLMVGESYGYVTSCAYDTAISLPQGSTKQFVVRLPRESITSINGEVQVTLLDGHSTPVADETFKYLLLDANALTMGILSDDYPSLTYLDMGGKKIDFYSDRYPVKLMELNKDNLTDALDILTFLVIDDYDTGFLTDDEILSIERWTDSGGVLIIGTGSHTEDTLRGFDSLGIGCIEVCPPGERTYFTYFADKYVYLEKLYMAYLYDLGSQYKYNHQYEALIGSRGDGAVGVLPFSLSEISRLDAFRDQYDAPQSEFVYYFLDSVSDYANVRHGTSNYMEFKYEYALQEMLDNLGNSSAVLNFGALKAIVIIYVILAGPVCYLILRFMKKRELYWVAVPAMALVAIFLVFFAGRGFEVASTRVYSVTVDDLSDRGAGMTYLHCYDAGHREWDLRLAEAYEYAGPQMSYGMDPEAMPYFHHIRKDDNRLFFGIKPSSGFKDCYFCAGKAADAQGAEGSIESESNATESGRFTAISTVTNNTSHDFAYFAVLQNDSVQVYGSLPAGTTAGLADDEIIFSSSLSGSYSKYVSMLWEAEDYVGQEEMDDITALVIGVMLAGQKVNAGGSVIVGMVKDWDKAVDDNCSEVSYGCLYMVQ